jgi:hypothetical protein
MKRSAVMCLLLASGVSCTSVQQGPDLGGKTGYKGQQVVPNATAATWKDFSSASTQARGDSTPGGRTPAMAAPSGPTLVQASAASPVPAAAAAAPTASPMPPDPAPAPPGQSPEPLGIGPGAATHLPPISHTDGPAGKQDKDWLVPPRTVGPTSGVKETSFSAPPAPDSKPVPPATPTVRLVNTKRVTLNYEVKDVGPSGISGVELWYTQDGKNWKKHSSPPRLRPPYIIEVAGEGLYGFTLLAHSGTGIAKEPPRTGDLPQVWVEVDMTNPVVQITGVEAKVTNRMPSVQVTWKATDKNLGHRPISLSYSDKETGPWQTIASQMENTGQYTWQVPTTLPGRLFLRVEASDLAGNVGMAVTSKPVVIDMAQPSVAILAVEPGNK